MADYYWLISSRKLLQDQRLNKTDFIISTMLIGLTRSTGICKATNAYIAQEMGMSISKVSESVSRLEKAGYIEREVTKGRRKITLSEWFQNDLDKHGKETGPLPKNGKTPSQKRVGKDSSSIGGYSNPKEPEVPASSKWVCSIEEIRMYLPILQLLKKYMNTRIPKDIPNFTLLPDDPKPIPVTSTVRNVVSILKEIESKGLNAICPKHYGRAVPEGTSMPRLLNMVETAMQLRDIVKESPKEDIDRWTLKPSASEFFYNAFTGASAFKCLLAHAEDIQIRSRAERQKAHVRENVDPVIVDAVAVLLEGHSIPASEDDIRDISAQVQGYIESVDMDYLYAQRHNGWDAGSFCGNVGLLNMWGDFIEAWNGMTAATMRSKKTWDLFVQRSNSEYGIDIMGASEAAENLLHKWREGKAV